MTFFERHSLNIVADSNHATASRAVRGARALQSLRVASAPHPLSNHNAPRRPLRARGRACRSVCLPGTVCVCAGGSTHHRTARPRFGIGRSGHDAEWSVLASARAAATGCRMSRLPGRGAPTAVPTASACHVRKQSEPRPAGLSVARCVAISRRNMLDSRSKRNCPGGSRFTILRSIYHVYTSLHLILRAGIQELVDDVLGMLQVRPAIGVERCVAGTLWVNPVPMGKVPAVISKTRRDHK